METAAEKRRLRINCPVRCALAVLGAALTGLYFALRGNSELMLAVSEGFVRPYHAAAGKICSLFPFSVAELFYAAAVIGGICYLAHQIRALFKGRGAALVLRRTALTIFACAAMFYGGFCLLWGVYYHSFDFEELSGLAAEPVSTEDLAAVTAYFASMVNDCADSVPRDENGLYCGDTDDILNRSAGIYGGAEEIFPFLKAEPLRPKAMVFSEIMSKMNFTGFFFPFTGEANLNVNAPFCFLACTAAHEIAHQRGVAAEDEANFVAVLASLESGDADFVYSGALMGYLYLSNALYSADSLAYYDVAATLCGEAKADLRANNDYWAQYKTKTAEISESVYTGFLYSHGDDRGMQSYGACVDLLTAYYIEEALGA